MTIYRPVFSFIVLLFLASTTAYGDVTGTITDETGSPMPGANIQVEGTQVGTVGQIEAFPGAPNVVPGRVALSLEIRDLAMDKIDRVFDSIAEEAAQLGSANHTAVTLEQFYQSEGAPTDESIRTAAKSFSAWPTFPQIYLGGEFIGGNDILMEMYDAGELQKRVYHLQKGAYELRPGVTLERAPWQLVLAVADAEAAPSSTPEELGWDLLTAWAEGRVGREQTKTEQNQLLGEIRTALRGVKANPTGL